jgi:diguanylate cyclase (GGDEF)-like protein/PAS domain S-box-containing protein
MAKRASVDEARLVAAVLLAFEEAGAEYEPVLDEVCRLGTELTGDAWVIRLIDDDGTLRLAGSAAPDEASLEGIRRSLGQLRISYDDTFGSTLLRDGSAVLITSETPGARELGERWNVDAAVLAPLRVRGRVIGTLWWLWSDHERDPDADDQLFASSVADRCALAIDNARLLRELSARSQRHAALLAHVSDAIVVVDAGGTITEATDGVPRIMGWEADELLGTNVFDLVHPDDQAHAAERFLEVLGDDDLPATTVRLRHRDGSWRHLEVSGDDLLGDPSVNGVVITAHDVSDRWWAEELLTAENEVLDLIARDEPLTTVLDAITTLVDSRIGGVASIWLHDDDRDDVLLVSGPGVDPASRAVVGSSSLGGAAMAWIRQLGDDVVVGDPARDPQWVDWRDVAEEFGIRGSWTHVILDSAGATVGALIVYRGALDHPTMRQRQATSLGARLAGLAVHRDRDARRLAHAATHDSVTGVANRAYFLTRLDEAIERQATGAEPPAVLFVDLDRFKQLNDRAGHFDGDLALRILAERLQSLVRPADVVARFGGDEFSVLCEETSEDVAEQVAQRLLDAVREPVEVSGRTYVLSASIGLAVGRAGVDAETLLRRADLAMYRAKSIGRSRVVRYEPAMRTLTDGEDLERGLRRALEHDEIRLEFQPLADLATRAWRGVEALARWDHPDRGPVPPDVFVAIAEESDLVRRLGNRVLDLVVAQLATWRDDPVMRSVVVGANVSGRHLSDPSFVSELTHRFAASGVKPNRLLIELTETSMMEDYESARATVQALGELGVTLVIDDFGTGQSTLTRLRQFPAFGVKLDRSFIEDLAVDHRSEDIVAAVVQLAHALGMVVCAEGVETGEQLAAVQRLGVDLAQGFLLARPAPAAEVAALFSRPIAALRPGHLKIAE